MKKVIIHHKDGKGELFLLNEERDDCGITAVGFSITVGNKQTIIHPVNVERIEVITEGRSRSEFISRDH